MQHELVELPGLLPMYATPPELASACEEMKAEAPYCGLGFKKSKLEPELHERLLDHFRACGERFRAEGPVEYIGVENERVVPCLFYEDRGFNDRLSRDLLPRHEKWSGLRLEESACYGIRVYQRGSYLYNHVDRTRTHIISSTICVDHRLSKPWPLAIQDIDGAFHQVDMEPGEFVFFEGARLVHGRPYPLDGDYYASIFVHYRPSEIGTQTGP